MPKFDIYAKIKGTTTIEDWQWFLRNFQYKPGFTFTVERCTYSHYGKETVTPFLRIVGTVIDAYHQDQMVELQHYAELRSCFSEVEMLDEVARHIMDLEKHEIAEFIQYKGKRPFNPHNPTGRKL